MKTLLYEARCMKLLLLYQATRVVSAFSSAHLWLVQWSCRAVSGLHEWITGLYVAAATRELELRASPSRPEGATPPDRPLRG